jgi:hypothetical protein
VSAPQAKYDAMDNSAAVPYTLYADLVTLTRLGKAGQQALLHEVCDCCSGALANKADAANRNPGSSSKAPHMFSNNTVPVITFYVQVAVCCAGGQPNYAQFTQKLDSVVANQAVNTTAIAATLGISSQAASSTANSTLVGYLVNNGGIQQCKVRGGLQQLAYFAPRER